MEGKRRKKELTEFDKLDAVTMWGKEMMDLHWDADKNSAEATAAIPKYNESATRVDEQGHAPWYHRVGHINGSALGRRSF